MIYMIPMWMVWALWIFFIICILNIPLSIYNTSRGEYEEKITPTWNAIKSLVALIEAIFFYLIIVAIG